MLFIQRYSMIWGILLLVCNAHAESRLPDFTALVEANSAAVVNISTTRKLDPARMRQQFQLPDDAEGALGDLLRRFFGEQGERFLNRETHSLGSGFIISKDGYIITNNHVVSEADEIIVRLSDRRELAAEVIGTDVRSDLALLKIDAKDLPVVKRGNAEMLKVGEWVLAIGSPFGFEHSVTAGIVSAKGRSLPNENYVPFIQTDVAINPGNSGGPLFNLAGEVVGVNSQIYSRTGGFMGLSFAIPIDVAMEVVDQLKNKGHVSRGWLGVIIQEVTRELAESFGMDKPYGALVSKVLQDSPADKAGLKPGDIIVAFNGMEVKSSAALPPMVGRVSAGETAQLRILRDVHEKTLRVKIEELPEEERVVTASSDSTNEQSASNKRLGMALSEPDNKLLEEYGLQDGVLVAKVMDGPALEAGLQPGDIITRLNNNPVAGLADFLEKIDMQKPGTSVALLVQRRQGPLFLALRIPK